MKVLLIDTCGDVGSVALGLGVAVVALESLPARGASVELLPAVARLLASQCWVLGDLDGVGVVSGPGSFTGVRVGLAAAKGLCEAAGLRLVGVSRLAVLAEAAGLTEGVAVLNAGRGEVYARVVRGGENAREILRGAENVVTLAAGGRVVVAEEMLREKLAGLHAELVDIDAEVAMSLVLQELEVGSGDAALVEANYVRAEGDIYARVSPAPKADPA